MGNIIIALWIGACIGMAFGWGLRAMMCNGLIDSYRYELKAWQERAEYWRAKVEQEVE